MQDGRVPHKFSSIEEYIRHICHIENIASHVKKVFFGVCLCMRPKE